MLFRITAPHTHRAQTENGTFTCYRQVAVDADSKVKISWTAYRGETLLQGDCRTLNDAKKVCRLAGRSVSG